MHTGVGRSVVDKDLTVAVGNPTVGKGHVHHIAYIFVTLRHKEIAAGLGDHLCGIIEGRHIHIKDIAQTVGRGTYAMRQMQPTFRGLDGMRALTVLHLRDGVVVTGVDDLLFLHLSMGDVIDECPTDTATGARIDEAILRTGIESIFPIHELRMQHDIALLTPRLQVGQTFPRLQVLRTGYACRRCGGREVARL